MASKLNWSKNELIIFCRTCRSLSNAVYRFSLPFLVSEFSRRAIFNPPPPRPCEGGSGTRPCAGYNSACSDFWISEPTHRHERTDWRLGWRIGMKRPEQPTKINETDYPGKTAPALVTADVVLSIPPPPPPPPNRLWYLPYLGIRSPLVAATASMSGCPATANIFDGTAWSLLRTDRGCAHTRSFKCDNR